MATVENKQDKFDQDTNASNANPEPEISDKSVNSWQSPVVSSAKSAFGRFLSRGESSDKTSSASTLSTESNVSTQKKKRKRKYSANL